MDEPTIEEWMDRHHVEIVRTHTTNLDGHVISKMLNRPKFLKCLPEGHNISDMALAQDYTGFPHLTFWHESRNAHLGDIRVKPDISTIVSDGTDADLGHCIGNFVTLDGSAISICPRTLLQNVAGQINDLGYETLATFELEFYVFANSFGNARRGRYQNLSPVTASMMSNIYLARNAYHVKPFMDALIKRINWQGFAWESWSDEGGAGQVELNFPPQDPVTAADTISRVKQIAYEVAVDLDMSISFMPSIGKGYSSGMHIHHSLKDKEGKAAFRKDGERSELFHHWVAGILKTMPGATSILCPTINAYRRLREFAAPPVVASWGEENKTAGLRVMTTEDSTARIEHRLPSSDTNPYLALAAILAGGIAGYKNKLDPPEELLISGWGLPDDYERLPNQMRSAADALSEDELLADVLGKDVVDYWVNSRVNEWLSFASESDPESRSTTDWEFNRYFELA